MSKARQKNDEKLWLYSRGMSFGRHFSDSTSLKTRLAFLYAILVLIYAALLFLVPPKPGDLEKYDITLTQLRLIDVTVIVPYALIWLAGFYGFLKLKEYSSRIRRSKDGRAINQMANGVLLLVLWPPLSSILATALNWLVLELPGADGVRIIINNYFNLLLPLAGFSLISVGARALSDLVKVRPSQRAINLLVLVLIGLGVAFGALISSAVDHSTYYPLPYWLVLATLVVPYIFMWFLGLTSAYWIYLYRQKTPGVVYRRSWGLLALGIWAIITMQIIVQYASTLAAQLDKLSFSWLVLVVYIVLILLSVGYILVARGARNLQKIEDV